LGGDLAVDAPELVPAAAVEAEEGEGVGGCVEGHGGGGWEWARFEIESEVIRVFTQVEPAVA